jgi:hypothetical protein
MFHAINHWYNVTDMCIYVTFSGLLIKKDQIPTIEAKELTVLKGPEDIQFHQLS